MLACACMLHDDPLADLRWDHSIPFTSAPLYGSGPVRVHTLLNWPLPTGLTAPSVGTAEGSPSVQLPAVPLDRDVLRERVRLAMAAAK